jgi:uncharacterized protein YecE (DUF72 family)
MIHIGTCSWTEKTLIKSGEFYPKEVKSAEDRLRYYAASFDTVEVDSSYYAIPDIKNAMVWAERTPGNFIFHVKAFGALTGHGVDPKTLPAEVISALPSADRDKKYVYIKDPELLQIIGRRFTGSLAPLTGAGKLGVVVFQFPPWLHYTEGNLDHIVGRVSLINGLRAAVEFRHGSWLSPGNRETVMDFLRGHGITYVPADEPQYGNLATVPFFPMASTDTAYFRFHGRNKENWLKKGLETSLRYDYLYSEEELKEFIPPLLAANEKISVVFAMFNNCHGASAIRNARRMQEIIRAKGKG